MMSPEPVSRNATPDDVGPSGNRAPSMSAQQLHAAARTLLLAATAAECMCDCAAVPAFTDSLISWILRMPIQCALAVLLSRSDLSLEEVFSPNHALWCSRSSTAAHRSVLGTEPPGAFQILGSDSGSPLGSKVEEAFADIDDPGQLWLQVRYLSAVLRRGEIASGDDLGNGSGLPDVSTGHKIWVLYLSQLLRLALIAADGRWEGPPQAVCTHSRYGPQVLVRGFAVTEEWMAPELIDALWHPGVLAVSLLFWCGTRVLFS